MVTYNMWEILYCLNGVYISFSHCNNYVLWKFLKFDEFELLFQ